MAGTVEVFVKHHAQTIVPGVGPLTASKQVMMRHTRMMLMTIMPLGHQQHGLSLEGLRKE